MQISEIARAFMLLSGAIETEGYRIVQERDPEGRLRGIKLVRLQ